MKQKKSSPTEPKSPTNEPIRATKAVASIYTTRNGAYTQYTVCWRAGRKRYRRKFSNLADAEKEMKRVSEQLANGELEILKLTPDDCRAYLNARRLLKPLACDLNDFVENAVKATKALAQGVSLLDAARQSKELLQLLPSGCSPKEACEDFARRNRSIRESRKLDVLADEYIERKRLDGVGVRHLADLETRLPRFADAFPGYAVGQVTRPMIQAHLDALKTGARSKGNDLRAIKALLKYAVDSKYAPRDVFDDVRTLKAPKPAPPPTLIFTSDELAEMLYACPPALVPHLVVTALCGLRSAEAMRLDWSNVNLKRKHVEVPAVSAKTKSRRLVPLCDSAVSWLKLNVKSEGRIAHYAEENKFCSSLVEAVNAARVRQAKEDGTELDKVPVFKWKKNGLRHGFCSHRLAVTQDAAKTALEAGHAVGMLHAHYKELVSPEEGQKWFGIFPIEDANILPMTKAA